MIVGVTGFFAAGKDTFAEILIQKGFKHVSLSDIIRAEIRQRGEEITIPRLTEVGNELRTGFGPQILAERALRVLPEESEAVVTSIRHGAEVEALRARKKFVMVFVDAPSSLRHQRSLARAREGDPVSHEDFEAAERRQMASDDPNAQQLARCKEMADQVIQNDGSLPDFREKIERFLKEAARKLAM